jgi:hypothetical protein
MIRINSVELQATRAKLTKINDRAAKRGFTGRIDLAVERVEVTTTDDFGFQRTDILFDVALSGEAPKYNGWTFLATLDWDQHAGLITRTVPGVNEDIDHGALKEGWCDHCQTNRQRNSTYLVRHDDGRRLQVGSTCIKDFLGWNAHITVLYADDITEELGFGGYSGQPDAVDTKYAMAVAWALIKLDGYKPASSFGSTTKGDVIDVLWPPRTVTQQRREELARIRELADEAMVRAQECITWVLTDMTGTGEYAKNLKAIVGADYVTIRNIGVLASAPQTWAKALHRTLIQNSATVSQWIGAKGDKVTFTAVVNDIRFVQSGFGGITLYTMQTPEGNVVKWFSSAGTLGDKPGETFTLKATVKDLEEFRDVKQTLITRAKIVATG